MKKIIKNNFLEDEAVKGFISYLANLIDGGDGTFRHNYKIRSSGEYWECNSLENAFSQYFWKGKNYSDTKIKLDLLKSNLRESYYLDNEVEFKKYCQEILEWGGVSAHNLEWMDNKKNNLIQCFSNAKEILTSSDSEIRNDDWNRKGYLHTSKFRMNSGYTKIYSLLCDNYIIYDSRVAAALGKIISNYIDTLDYCEGFETKNLQIRIMSAKEGKNTKLPKNRDPSTKKIIFKKINQSIVGALHAEWNIKANWILIAAINKSSSNWDGVVKEDKLRALEAALFMIGYDLGNLQAAQLCEAGRVKAKAKSKKHQAIEIYNANLTLSRAEIMSLFMSEATLTKAGASTYYQNCKNSWRYTVV